MARARELEASRNRVVEITSHRFQGSEPTLSELEQRITASLTLWRKTEKRRSKVRRPEDWKKGFQYPWQHLVFDAFVESRPEKAPYKVCAAQMAISRRLLDSGRLELSEHIAIREALQALQRLLHEQLQLWRKSWEETAAQ
jgi:hypothetical protein